MTQRVDFSLILNGKSKVFIEVKRVGEELDHHQEQLLNYAFKEGFELSMPIIFIMLRASRCRKGDVWPLGCCNRPCKAKSDEILLKFF
jgi:predicted type IV restriction endonuclease